MFDDYMKRMMVEMIRPKKTKTKEAVFHKDREKNYDLYIEAKELYSLYNYWVQEGKSLFTEQAATAKRTMRKHRKLAFLPDRTPLPPITDEFKGTMTATEVNARRQAAKEYADNPWGSSPINTGGI